MFLGSHPKVTKWQSVTAPKTSIISDQSVQQRGDQLIIQQRDILSALEIEYETLREKVQTARKCTQAYDPSKELADLEAKLAAAQQEQAQLNKKIQDCQKIEANTVPEQYFLWQQKQRTDAYRNLVAQLYLSLEAAKESHRQMASLAKNQCVQLRQAIEQMEEKLRRHQLSEQEGDQEEDYLQQYQANQKLKEELSAVTNTVEILQQNREILTAQLISGVENIQKSLHVYFESDKIRLLKELKQIKVSMNEKEVSPVTSEEANYKLDPFFKDYSCRIKEILAVTPETVRTSVNAVMKPLPWEGFQWRQLLESNKSKQSLYEQYKRIELECMENEVEIKKIEQELADVIKETNTITAQQKQLSGATLKIQKMLQK